MDSELEVLMLNARSNAPNDLDALIHHVVSHREALFSALPVLYHHLDPARLAPELSTRQLHQNLDLALIGLAAFLDGRADNPNAPKLHASLLENWALLWRWVQFMTSRCILRADEFGEDMRHKAIFTITNFYKFAMGATFRHKLLTRPGIRIVFQVWASVINDATLEDAHELVGAVRRALHPVLSACQAAVAREPRSPLGAHVKAVLDEPAGEFAHAAVARFICGAVPDAADQGPMPALGDVTEQLSVIVALGGFSTRVLHRLFSARLLPTLATFLAYFATLRADAADAGAVVPALDVLLRCTERVLRGAGASPHSGVWMAQVLEGNMIRTSWMLFPLALAHGGARHGSGCETFISWLLVDLQKHLLHWPVFRATLHALRTIEPTVPLYPDRSAPTVRMMWEELRKAVNGRKMAEPAWREHRRRCGYAQCAGASGFLRRCGGCFELLYCSARCQRRDWAHNGHRAVCQEKQRCYREGEPAPWSEGLTQYFVDISMHLSKARLSPFYQQMHAVPPARVAVLTFDYTYVPIRIAVWSLDPEHPPAAERKREVTGAFVEAARAAGAEGQALVEVVYSAAGSVQQMLVIR